MRQGHGRYPWQRRRRQLLRGAAFFLFLCALPFVLFRWQAKGRVEKELEAIRASGMPVTLAESAKLYPANSADTDGAKTYEDAFKAKKELREAPDVYKAMSREQGNALQPVSFSEELRKTLRDHLDANAEQLRLLHEAVKHPVSRFPLDFSKGVRMELPHLAKIRDAVRLLQLEAFVASEDGDTNRATQAILGAMTTTDTLRSEPVVISQLVRCACQGIVVVTLTRVLVISPLDEDQLKSLSTVFAHAENPEILPRMFAMERAQALTLYDHPEDIVSTWGKIDELDALIPGGTESLIRAATAVGVNDGDKIRYLHLSNELTDASRLPYHQMLPAMRNVEQEITQSSSFIPRISALALGALSREGEAFARSAAYMRTAYVALALERYRLATDRLPPTLDDLIPLFLKEVPKDPFDNQPLRYQPREKGFVVYSVGLNLQDDQGETSPKNADWRSKGDLTFQVTR